MSLYIGFISIKCRKEGACVHIEITYSYIWTMRPLMRLSVFACARLSNLIINWNDKILPSKVSPLSEPSANICPYGILLYKGWESATWNHPWTHNTMPREIQTNVKYELSIVSHLLSKRFSINGFEAEFEIITDSMSLIFQGLICMSWYRKGEIMSYRFPIIKCAPLSIIIIGNYQSKEIW